MKIGGEVFLLVNTLANGLSLWLAARLLGTHLPSPKRLVWASLAGTAYGVAAFLPGLSFLKMIPFVLLSSLMMAKILLPDTRPLFLCKAALLTLLSGLLLGGLGGWLMQQGLSAWLTFGTLFLSMAGAAFFCVFKLKPPSQVTMVEIAIANDDISGPIRLPAMLDTGNQLTDPITGLPVVVASSSALRPILPAAVKPEDPETLPMGFRLLRVQTTAGHRLMMCFHPTLFRVQLEGTWHESHALVAIAPTGYDGAQALVPAAVVEAL